MQANVLLFLLTHKYTISNMESTKLYPSNASHERKESLIQKQASDIESLSLCNQILKDHLDFLRNKIKQQEEQLELFTELICVLHEEKKEHRFRINLN
jgi:hypothetical protein